MKAKTFLINLVRRRLLFSSLVLTLAIISSAGVYAAERLNKPPSFTFPTSVPIATHAPSPPKPIAPTAVPQPAPVPAPSHNTTYTQPQPSAEDLHRALCLKLNLTAEGQYYGREQQATSDSLQFNLAHPPTIDPNWEQDAAAYKAQLNALLSSYYVSLTSIISSSGCSIEVIEYLVP